VPPQDGLDEACLPLSAGGSPRQRPASFGRSLGSSRGRLGALVIMTPPCILNFAPGPVEAACASPWRMPSEPPRRRPGTCRAWARDQRVRVGADPLPGYDVGVSEAGRPLGSALDTVEPQAPDAVHHAPIQHRRTRQPASRKAYVQEANCANECRKARGFAVWASLQGRRPISAKRGLAACSNPANPA
jgi:hypothetical protein